MKARKNKHGEGSTFLTIEDIVDLRKAVQQRFEREKGIELVIKSTPKTYQLLSEEIHANTEMKISETWLRDFFYVDVKRGCTKQTTILNAFCSYAYGGDISAEEYLKFKPDSHEDILGVYDVWWTGSTRNSETSIHSVELEVELSNEESVLTRRKDKYRGSPPVKIADKVYVSIFNHKNREQVNIILHIGDAEKEDLEYIPGIFASGDHGNINPCCGPIMLVSKEIKKPNTALLKAYFKSYVNNNLIKSWTISEVLEKKKELSIKVMEGSSNEEEYENTNILLDKKLGLYLNRRFFFYYWNARTLSNGPASIGRATLEIGTDRNEVKLVAPMGGTYTGSVEMATVDHLHFRFRTMNTKEKHQSIKFRVGSDQIFPYAVGAYSIIDNYGAVIVGTAILEHYQGAESEFDTRLFPVNEPSPGLDENIREFLRNKDQNYIKIKSEGIFREQDFLKFFEEQSRKERKLRRGGKSGIFIATPMSANVQLFEELRMDVIELQKLLGEIFQTSVYYAGREYDPEVGFTHALTAIEIDLKKLREADRFILIHPEKVASSTLVELGWALAESKSCVIFYKNEQDLPFLIKGLNLDNIKRTQYEDMRQVKNLVKHLGENLFP